METDAQNKMPPNGIKKKNNLKKQIELEKIAFEKKSKLEEIKQELLNIDINGLTPVEALMKLNHIKEKVNPKKRKK